MVFQLVPEIQNKLWMYHGRDFATCCEVIYKMFISICLFAYLFKASSDFLNIFPQVDNAEQQTHSEICYKHILYREHLVLSYFLINC